MKKHIAWNYQIYNISAGNPFGIEPMQYRAISFQMLSYLSVLIEPKQYRAISHRNDFSEKHLPEASRKNYFTKNTNHKELFNEKISGNGSFNEKIFRILN